MVDGHDAGIVFEVISPPFRIRHPASIGAAQLGHCQPASSQQTPQRLGRGENGPFGISRSQQFNEVFHEHERAPATWRRQMRDFDDLAAANRASKVVLQELLHGLVEVAFRKERLVAKADAGSALDTAGWTKLRDDCLCKRRQERLVALPVELLDRVFDDRPQAIGSRHHNEHWLSPSHARTGRSSSGRVR